MNPHQKNKVDISKLSADEQRLFRLYGKLPNKKDLLQNKLAERKYFDSGDYALSKAGKASDTGVTTIGTEHPQAENIPHLTASSPPNSAASPSGNIPGSVIGGGGTTTTTGTGVGSRVAAPGKAEGPPHQRPQEGSHFMPGTGGNRGSIHGMPMGGVFGMSAPGAPAGGLGRAAARSPIKEGSYLARMDSVDDKEPEAEVGKDGAVGKEGAEGEDTGVLTEELSVSPPPVKEGLPIRR